MSQFLKKAGWNKQAVDLLINDNNASPSIKCSYYRCVQQMLHVIYYKLSYSEEEIILKSKIPGSAKTTGTHKIAITIISDRLRKLKYEDPESFKYFTEKIHELKKLRELADYKDCEIDMTQARQAQSWADALTGILDKKF